MRAGLVRLSVIFVLGVVVLGLSACSGDVSESDEYIALQTELEEQTARLEMVESELSASQSDLDEARESRRDGEAA